MPLFDLAEDSRPAALHEGAHHHAAGLRTVSVPVVHALPAAAPHAHSSSAPYVNKLDAILMTQGRPSAVAEVLNRQHLQHPPQLLTSRAQLQAARGSSSAHVQFDNEAHMTSMTKNPSCCGVCSPA